MVHEGYIARLLLVRSPDSGGYVKFITKYIIVGGEGGLSEICLRVHSYSFGHLVSHAKFQNPSGLFLVSRRRRR